MAFATAVYACVSAAHVATAQPGFENAARPYEKGFQIGGIAFGLTRAPARPAAKPKPVPRREPGLSFGRIFARSDAAVARGFGAVSDTVFGLDLRVRVAARPVSGALGQPVALSVGGAPLRALALRPTTFSFWENAFFPRFERPAAAPSEPPLVSAYAPSAALSVPVPAPPRLDTARLGSSLVAQRLQDRQGGGGVSFPVAVLGKHVAVHLDAELEHLYRHEPAAAAYLPVDAGGRATSQAVRDRAAASDAAALVAGSPAVRYFPNYVDVVHSTLSAGASLPLTRGVVFSASFDTQGYRSGYGTTIGPSIAERKDQYQGTVTYTLPKTGSSVSVLFRNQQYHDAVLPTFNLNANREDLNFTVRF